MPKIQCPSCGHFVSAGDDTGIILSCSECDETFVRPSPNRPTDFAREKELSRQSAAFDVARVFAGDVELLLSQKLKGFLKVVPEKLRSGTYAKALESLKGMTTLVLAEAERNRYALIALDPTSVFATVDALFLRDRPDISSGRVLSDMEWHSLSTATDTLVEVYNFTMKQFNYPEFELQKQSNSINSLRFLDEDAPYIWTAYRYIIDDTVGRLILMVPAEMFPIAEKKDKIVSDGAVSAASNSRETATAPGAIASVALNLTAIAARVPCRVVDNTHAGAGRYVELSEGIAFGVEGDMVRIHLEVNRVPVAICTLGEYREGQKALKVERVLNSVEARALVETLPHPDSSIDVEAGRVELSVGEVLDLQKGAVILLDDAPPAGSRLVYLGEHIADAMTIKYRGAANLRVSKVYRNVVEINAGAGEDH